MENGEPKKTGSKKGMGEGSKATQFKPGQRGGPGRGNKKPKPKLVGDMVAAMEQVLYTAEQASDSPLVKGLRKRAHDEPLKFLDQYMKVKESAGGTEHESHAEMGSVGPKEVALEELAEKLLSEWEETDGRPDRPAVEATASVGGFVTVPADAV